ncbi:hypothetical protein J1N35_046195 [Gossypium stocksii]|uniref:Uncharacterized protein n=1 Tax=Gossypium stocksii TaxID=47602 RepID=A0A9D3ZED1_9ROSI|nr:hypothetical protein J1N35_046195 [Gossypium stocksii]
MESSNQAEFDYLFKLLMIGDSGVGKSSLLLSFTSDSFENSLPLCFVLSFDKKKGNMMNEQKDCVDFKVKYVNAGDKKLKLAIWDTVETKSKAAFPSISQYAMQ